MAMTKPFMKRSVLNLALILCSVFLVLVVGYLLLGDDEAAVEFSPDKFCHRSVSYIHFFGMRLGPFDIEEWQTSLERYLHDAGLVPPSPQDPARWHYVRGNRRRARGPIGQAYWKCVSMGCHRRSDRSLVEWSEENPRLAEVLWPKVVSLARDERYRALSELFPEVTLEELAGTTPEELLAFIASVEAASPE